jgi:hypothetical protein
MGYIYRGEPGLRATASEQSRLVLRLPTALLHRKLKALLDGQKIETIAFKPMFDQTRGAGAAIRRMFDFLFAELEDPNTLLTNELAVRSFEVRIPMKPAGDSDLKAATHSDFKAATIPI